MSCFFIKAEHLLMNYFAIHHDKDEINARTLENIKEILQNNLDVYVQITRNDIIGFCLFCEKPVNTKNIFCNNKCQRKYEYNIWIHKWKSGEDNGMRGKYGTAIQLRRYLFEKYNYKCCRCGWDKINPYTNKIPLEVEHIDGNYMNNNEENLELLCPNCHSLTPTYKGANMGKGRKDRKKYSDDLYT